MCRRSLRSQGLEASLSCGKAQTGRRDSVQGCPIFEVRSPQKQVGQRPPWGKFLLPGPWPGLSARAPKRTSHS